MTNNVSTETIKHPTAEELEAALTLMYMHISANYSRAEWDAALTLVSLSTSSHPTSTKPSHNTSEIATQPSAEAIEAALILMSMRNNTTLSPADWEATLALVKVRTSHGIVVTDYRESPQTLIGDDGSHGRDTHFKRSSSDTTAEIYETDTIDPMLRRRVTRSMGFRMTTAAAYDMSYHPLDDVIGRRAQGGMENI